jgi:hypothetical protein
VQFFVDGYEDRDDYRDDVNTPSAVHDLVTCHTLYPKGDVDYVRIRLDAPNTVKIETVNLSNGADTFVQLVDSNDNVVVMATPTGPKVLENDNAPVPKLFTPVQCGNRQTLIPQAYFDIGINNGARLASTVSTGASLLPAGTYYAKVSSSPNRGPGSGELGSYDLVVTFQ